MAQKFHALAKVDGGYKLRDRSTGEVGMYSKKPQSKEKALAQLRAIEFHKHSGFREYHGGNK